jgi:MoaA/NifB/PqqE/SkfB family radical SAM enzyme
MPKLVNFSGMGEPTINPLLPDFIAYLSGKVPAVQITTNVSILDTKLSKSLVNAGLNKVFVSFNGHTDILYKKMMGGLSFEHARENVESLLCLAKGKTEVAANVSVTEINKNDLPDIQSYIHKMGIQEVVFAQCHHRGGYFPNRSVCTTPMPSTGEGRCDVFKNTLFVAWDGRVLSCCHDLEGKAVVGDLKRDNLEQIIARKRDILREGVYFPMCKDCNDFYRFIDDPTPEGSSLSEWIYALYASEDERTAKLIETIGRRDARIRELEQLVEGYKNGWCIRTLNWLKRAFRI